MASERQDLQAATQMTPGGGQAFSLTPRSLDEAMQYAEVISKSDIVPQDYKGKSGNVLVAIQMGLELGLPPLQALQNIAVINGRPAVWGDSLMAIARAHPSCEYITEEFDEKTMTARCRVKRRGEPEQVRAYSQADAEMAGLWKKQGPWQSYPKRMLQMRARGFAVRDVFPDALRGVALAEEAQDIPPRDVTPAQSDTPRPAEPAALPFYDQESFDTNLPKWKAVIESGKKSADDIIAMVETKGQLTDEQKQQIRAAETAEGDDE